ncbi:hypothetical protein G3I19_03385 [Streptomyces sp. SID10853]|uniref:hypothetical protein n=1 Tax=Streptomyces sp. SID10853 TaxID=2706028 RepID=UPI0013C1BA31|nr:hypothetical protein [Streptomyces sp. SID10853]NDZ77581.1 hypothetical protein [Streptomyces sp. SID10853]
MVTLTSVIDGVGIVPPFSFIAPLGLHSLPIAPTPEERAALSHQFVRELYSGGDESIWEPAAPYYSAIAEYMGDSGLAYSAMGLFSTEEGNVAQCSFTVAAVETDQSDPDVAATGTLAILSTDPHNDARWLDLPCGPAVTCVRMHEVTLSPEVTASGEETKLMTGQIQVYIPFPTGPYTAVFTLDTASVDYWGEFCDMVAAILQTISFAPPEESAQSEVSTETESPELRG